MSTSVEQLQEAVDAARRMRNALDAHLSVLDRRVERASAEGRQLPSENLWFVYVSDAQGLIRIQQDAAFIVESVLVVQSVPVYPTLTSVQFYEVALKDGNAGRDITGSFHAIYAESPLREEDSNFVPGVQFVPLTSFTTGAGSANFPNVDDWKTTKAEYILPRGSVIKASFRSSGVYGVGNGFQNALPTVLLSGYKVF